MKSVTDIVRIVVCGILIVYFIWSMQFDSKMWIVVSLTIVLSILLPQFFRSRVLQAMAIWFGIFLAAQSFLGVFLESKQHKSRIADFSRTIDVQEGLPGISGLQTISTDGYGFRVTRDVQYDDDNTFRVFAIGASTTEQRYLDDHKTWTHFLQTQLQPASTQIVEVVNTGVAGVRAVHSLATMEFVSDFHPDLFVILIGINDWNRYIVDQLSPAESPSLREQLFISTSPIGKLIWSVLRGGANQSKSNTEKADEITIERGEFYKDKRGSLLRSDSREFFPGEVDSDYVDVLEDMSDFCQKNEWNCIFLSQPTGYSSKASSKFKESFWMTPPEQDYTLTLESMEHIANLYNGFLGEFAEQKNIPFCDLAAQLPPTFDVLYDDCHFNEQGARQVSEVITQCLYHQALIR